ncbi:ROK family protein [Dellaglioa sp. BT-FLS60]
MLFGSIEGGGTKFICAVGNDSYQIEDITYFPTEQPEKTLKKIVEYFKKFDISALGIASFGPIELRKGSTKYGYITTSPKLGWQNTDMLGYFKAHFNIPISWNTDVNGSAYGEFIISRLSNESINSLVYYTIGDGVGAGIVDNGNFIGDIGHPEMGHVPVKRHHQDLKFKGICPYHSDCLEGLVSSPTFEARLGKRSTDVSVNDPIWEIMAYYVAQAFVQTTLTCRPGEIILGGSVPNPEFITKIKNNFMTLINGYIPIFNIDEYIKTPSIKRNESATIGNFALAKKLLNQL